MGAIETDSICLDVLCACRDVRPPVDLTAALAAEADVRLRIYHSPSQSHPVPRALVPADMTADDDMGGPRDELDARSRPVRERERTTSRHFSRAGGRQATTPTNHQIAISGQLFNWTEINEDKDRVVGRLSCHD